MTLSVEQNQWFASLANQLIESLRPVGLAAEQELRASGASSS